MNRRRWLAAALAAAGSATLGGCRDLLPPTYGSLLGIGEALTFASHRLLLRRQPLAREFGREMISKHFPAINTVNPEDETYQRLRMAGFVEWRLPVTGLVARPSAFSLAELCAFPARTQVTQHSCEQGWSAIAEWTGVSLSRVLEAVGMKPEARYVVFHCVDGWWDSLDLFDALHPQTILAYAMNGREVPVPHGAPIRLRVERQLGYKSLKYVNRITVTDRIDRVEDGTGGFVVRYGYSWYAGI
jgi:DMSO/TMAO reductase YedYZ molybdopterin-dependent catalytic subunit